MTADFDYKKYSLEKLEEWVHDALNCEDLTAQNIYETITNAVDENIEYHKKYLTKNIEVLSLLRGNRPVDFDDCMPPWGHSDMEALRYTEEELNAMCDKAASDQEKDKCREYNLREAEYYNKRAQLDLQQDDIFNNVFNSRGEDGATSDIMHSDYYYDYTRNDLNRQNPFKNKVKKWVLTVEQSFEDYFVSFPDDLLESANLKEGDEVEWSYNNDGSYILRKV